MLRAAISMLAGITMWRLTEDKSQTPRRVLERGTVGFEEKVQA